MENFRNSVLAPQSRFFSISLIFNRFYRVDKARSRQERGTGLGLSICKFIVDAHEGDIDIASKLGEGTKFKISLPKTSFLSKQKTSA